MAFEHSVSLLAVGDTPEGENNGLACLEKRVAGRLAVELIGTRELVSWATLLVVYVLHLQS